MIIPITKTKSVNISVLGMTVILFHILLTVVIVLEALVLLNLYEVLSNEVPDSGLVRTGRINFEAHSDAQDRYLEGQLIVPSSLDNFGNPFTEYDPPEGE